MTKREELEKKRADNKKLREDIKAGRQARLYVFYGEERYLLEYCLTELKGKIAAGTEEFNHRRLDGKTLTMDELGLAVDSVPVFSDFVLIEVWDYDFSKAGEDARKELLSILSDIPDYMTVVFVFDTVEYKLDGRIKQYKELLKYLKAYEFVEQDEILIRNWITRHFAARGKKIDTATAEYFAFVTGGLMTAMAGEVDKVASYFENELVTRSDIDAVVTPVVEAVSYELTDALLKRKYDLAVKKLGDLMYLNEAPHKVLFTVALTLRQLLCSRILQESGGGTRELMSIFGMRLEFQARNIFNSARSFSIPVCKKYLDIADETAFRLNSGGGDGGSILGEMILKISMVEG